MAGQEHPVVEASVNVDEDAVAVVDENAGPLTVAVAQ